MRTVTLSVASRDNVTRRALAAFSGANQGAHISFESIDLLWKILTPKRWELIKILTGQDPMSIREIARRANRDVKAVHGDIRAMLSAGLINKTEDNKVEFRFDAVHVDFTVSKAA